MKPMWRDGNVYGQVGELSGACYDAVCVYRRTEERDHAFVHHRSETVFVEPVERYDAQDSKRAYSDEYMDGASTVTWNTAPSYNTGTWNGIPAPTSHTISGDTGWWAFPYMKDVVAAMLRNYIDTSLSQTIHEKRGIMIKLADETVGLKTFRSSNHSENRPNMSITYTTSGTTDYSDYYGNTRQYVNWKFEYGPPNCWGYAVFKDYNVTPKLPHQYNDGTPATEAYCKEILRTYTNNNVSGVMLRNISGTGSYINSSEHRIAARMNRYPTDPYLGGTSTYTLQSYHFVVQLEYGVWAHKLNEYPSENLSWIDPSTNASNCWECVSGTDDVNIFLCLRKLKKGGYYEITHCYCVVYYYTPQWL